MRNLRFGLGGRYHLWNRGNAGQVLFVDEKDRIRFLFSLLYFQGEPSVHHVGSYVDYFAKHGRFNVSGRIHDRIIEKRLVALESFILLPNSFHLIVSEKTVGGIASFMHSVLVSHTKYFNTKYRRTGHLFAGPYAAREIVSDSEVKYLSAYLHKKPKGEALWRSRFHEYPWSSYQDAVRENRFGNLLLVDRVLGGLPKEHYKKFTEMCSAKAFTQALDETHMSED